jgi:hypothetical protein
MSRFEVRCHEWGDDSDYHWVYCNSLEEALKEMKDFHDHDPNNIYERLYVIEIADDGSKSIPGYNPETFEPIL